MKSFRCVVWIVLFVVCVYYSLSLGCHFLTHGTLTFFLLGIAQNQLQNYVIDGVNDDGTLFFDTESQFSVAVDQTSDDADLDADFDRLLPRFFNNPANQRLLDHDASLIPGSPFSKPGVRSSSRPAEPLVMASYVSGVAFLGSIAIVVFLLFNAVYTYGDNIGRVIIEMILALLSFFGLFWNLYFTVSSLFKCFIPSKAFLTNTKYCSIIPETKPPEAEWLDVTIQIPVYKESLVEVLMPTLRSCATSRDYYQQQTNRRCNIVVCDDGMMAFCK